MFAVVETTENDQRMVTALPQKWIVDGVLYWPPSKNLSIAKQCKKPIDPVIGEWKPYEQFKILQNNICSYNDARNREIYYSKYNNTDSEVEAIKIKNIQRDHPINFSCGDSGVDFNKIFEEKNKESQQKDFETSEICVECPENVFEENEKKIGSDIKNMSSKNIESQKMPTKSLHSKDKSNKRQKKNKIIKLYKNIQFETNKITQDSLKDKNEYIDYDATLKKNQIEKKVIMAPLDEQIGPTELEIRSQELSKHAKITKRKVIGSELTGIKKVKLQETPVSQNKNRKKDRAEKAIHSLKNKIDEQNIKIGNLHDNIDNLTSTVKVFTELLSAFIANNNTKENRDKIQEDPFFTMPALPAKSVTDLQNFNNFLLNENSVRQVAIRLKRNICSVMSLNKMVKKLLENLVSYDVLLLHFWSGKSRISAKAPKSKLVFSDYSGVISLMKLTISIVKEVDEDKFKKAIVEVLKRSGQNKAREDEKLMKAKQLLQPATSKTFDSTKDSTESNDSELADNSNSNSYSSDSN